MFHVGSLSKQHMVVIHVQWRSEGRAWLARARPKFVLLMCAQALVLLAQSLSVQQVPGQYQ